MPDPDQDPDTRNSNRASNETPCQNNCLMLVLALNTARWGEGHRGPWGNQRRGVVAPLSNGVEQAAGVTRPKHCLCLGGLHTGRRESTDSDLIPDAMSIWRDEKAAMSRRPDHTAQWVGAAYRQAGLDPSEP